MYRVTFHMITPIIFRNPIHFDALLGAVHPAMHNSGLLWKGTDISSLPGAPLPLDSIALEDKWQWCCSAMEYPETSIPFSDTIQKGKTTMDDLYVGVRQIKTNGWQKNSLISIYGLSCPFVWFDFSSKIIGDIKRLLRRVDYIGSHREKGYGKVSHFDVEEIDGSWKECIVKDGVARRNLQSYFVDCSETEMVNVKLPYWHTATLAEGAAVGTECRLKEEVFLKHSVRKGKKKKEKAKASQNDTQVLNHEKN